MTIPANDPSLSLGEGLIELGRRPRLFATPADEPRARRASDVSLLIVGVVGLISLSLAAIPLPGIVRALAALLEEIPSFFDGVWQVTLDVLAVLAVVLVVLSGLRGRLTIMRDLVLAGLLALGIGAVLARIVTGEWVGLWDALRSAGPPPWYPSLRAAVPSAIVITASPHLVLPLRRLGRWLVGFGALSVAMLGAATPIGATSGLLVAFVAAAVVHLVFGSSGGRPGLIEVRRALDELGVPTTGLGAADRQSAGAFDVDASGADGEPLTVRWYGRDAHDAALLSTLWRTVWYRDARAPIRLGRRQQVEHEAFMTLLAAHHGIATDSVVTAGVTSTDDALLVLHRRGPLLADAKVMDVDEARSLWRAIAKLHRANITHGQIDARSLARADGEIRIVGLSAAGVGPTTAQVLTDRAQTLTTTVLALGTDAALNVAVDELGRESLAAVLPYVQSPALTREQRRELRTAGIDLDELRSQASQLTGHEAPEIQRLHRITLGSLLRVLLPAFALIALISGIAGLDLDGFWDMLRDAKYWLIAAGFVATQIPRLTQAMSTLGASPVPLALGPVYALQLATSYINLAIPSTAARVALNIRFFQRQGVAPSAAVAAGALDGFSGLIVQAGLLLGLLMLTPASLDLQVGASSGSVSGMVVLIAVLAVVAVGVVLVVPKLRRFVVGWIKRLATEALHTVRGLRSWRRLSMLFGGNLATELLFANALGIFTRALGYQVGFDELLLINISVALLSGLLPIPGGIGVAEGGLTFGLVRAGMPEEVAFAAVMLYRMSSFYLPPIWGFFAMRWLERRRFL